MAAKDINKAVDAFIARWAGQVGGQERANYALFLSELCDVLGVARPEPASADHASNDYVFERVVRETLRDGTLSHQRIDLYKRGCFILEAKQSRQKGGTKEAAGDGDLLAAPQAPRGRRGADRAWDVLMMNARRQGENYVRLLPSDHPAPPFVIVCDVGHCFELYANFRGDGRAYDQFPDRQGFRIFLEDLRQPEIRTRLASLFDERRVHELDPTRRAAKVTREIATRLATVSKALEAARHPAEEVAGFLARTLFTMFAEDVGLLPEKSFRDVLKRCADNPALFGPMVEQLWAAMDIGDFAYALEAKVKRFNGEFFKDRRTLKLSGAVIAELLAAASADWKEVEPAIFGTLLEQALDPVERRKLGAHYTPRAYVERLVKATIIDPLREDWQTALLTITRQRDEGRAKDALATVKAFHDRLCAIRVLDPACGTGNFLYVALELMKRLEGEVLEVLADLGGQEALTGLEGHMVDPHQFLGLEINPRAAAIAELVLWIGHLQWHFRTRGGAPSEPILKAFRNIEVKDAVLQAEVSLKRGEDGRLVLSSRPPSSASLRSAPSPAREEGRSGELAPEKGEGKKAGTLSSPSPLAGEGGATAPGEGVLRPPSSASLRSAPSPARGEGKEAAAAPTRGEGRRIDTAESEDGNRSDTPSSPSPLAGEGGATAPGEGLLTPLNMEWRETYAYANPRRPPWPMADFIVGNPPFIGGKDLRARLGDDYTQALWQAHGHAHDSADFVMYWWDRAAELLTKKGTSLRRFGFVTTNSISQLFQRRVMEPYFKAKKPISLVMAIADHPWTKAAADSAAVRIAMTVAEAGSAEGVLYEVSAERGLDSDTPEISFSEQRGTINADLTVGVDVASVTPLQANEGLSSRGMSLHGAGFIVSTDEAKKLGLGRLPGLEQHIRLYRNGRDLTARPRGAMVIDLFGLDIDEVRSRFPEVYQHVITSVKPERDTNNRATYKDNWWIFGEPRRDLRPALANLPRYIATVETTKHRVFQFLDAAILPDNMLVAIGSDDAHVLGVLSSRIHRVWALGQGGTLEDRPRYTKSVCFDPFPFPAANEAQKARIRVHAEDIDALRKRVLGLHEHLTLTGLYNVLARLKAGARPAAPSSALRAPSPARGEGRRVEPAPARGEGRRVEPAPARGEGRGANSASTRGDGKTADTLSSPSPPAGEGGATAPGEGFLDAKEQRIFEDGLVLILKEHHDALDCAVADAYGWAADLSEDDILARLVALNKERAREEKRGRVRWLRPDYQIARFGSPQEKERQMEADLSLAALKAAKPSYPTDDSAQTGLVMAALAQASEPLDVGALARGFKQGERIARKVQAVLDALERWQLVARTPHGAYQLRRAA